jgi:hypothetical protein
MGKRGGRLPRSTPTTTGGTRGTPGLRAVRVAALVMALGLLAGSAPAAAETPLPSGPDVSPPTGSSAADVPRLAGNWVRIPKAPWGTQTPAAVAIDGDMLVLDERTGRLLLYDVERRSWERRAHLPKRAGGIGAWVWTGQELVVLDKVGSGPIVAYDPATDTWRTLPPSPLPGHDLAVFADGRIIAAHLDQDSEVDISRELAMLDLADGTWDGLPAPVGLERLEQLIWTGTKLLAITVGEAGDLVQVAALDPDVGPWSEPLTGPLSWDQARPVWTGDALVFSGSERFGSRSDAAFDPATMTWTPEDFHCSLSTGAALWTGELIVGTDTYRALDPAADACYRLPSRHLPWNGNAVVWTGDRVIYWSGGGGEEGRPNPYRRGGHAFVPDRTTGEAAGAAEAVSAARTWGPLAVVDDPGTSGLDAANGPGRLVITDRCVYLQTSRGKGDTLVFRSGQTRWDAERRQIVYHDRDLGEIRLSNGDRLMLGGYGIGSAASPDNVEVPIGPWIREPDATCPARRWVAEQVVPQRR